VSSVRAAVIDGVTLSCALDSERTPTSSTIILERIGELSADAEGDQVRLAAMGKIEPLAPEGSIPPEIAQHLNRPMAYSDGAPVDDAI